MTEHVSRCPNCETSFKVSELQLAAADGAVRCGACLQVFNAADYFVEAPIPDLFDQHDGSSASLDVDALRADDERGPESIQNNELQEEGSTSTLEELEYSDHTNSIDTQWVSQEQHEIIEQTVGSELTDTKNSNDNLASDNFPTDDLPNNDLSREDVADNRTRHETITHESTDSLAHDSQPELDTDTDKKVSDETEKAMNSHLDELGLHTLDSGDVDDVELKQGLQNLESDEPDSLVGELQQHVRYPRRTIYWFGGAVVLSLVLVGQYLWVDRHYLANKPEVRPYYLQFCNLTNCQLLEFSDLMQLKTDGLVVRSHPTVEDGLIVDALLRNEAPYRQAFPGLELRFSDIKGRTLAQRTFRPSSYLAGEMAGLVFIPASTEVRLSIEIVDPGSTAVSYSMSAVLGPS